MDNKFLNNSELWALTDKGLDALNAMVQRGIDTDLAFELLNCLFKEEEIYERLQEATQ